MNRSMVMEVDTYLAIDMGLITITNQIHIGVILLQETTEKGHVHMVAISIHRIVQGLDHHLLPGGIKDIRNSIIIVEMKILDGKIIHAHII